MLEGMFYITVYSTRKRVGWLWSPEVSFQYTEPLKGVCPLSFIISCYIAWTKGQAKSVGSGLIMLLKATQTNKQIIYKWWGLPIIYTFLLILQLTTPTYLSYSSLLCITGIDSAQLATWGRQKVEMNKRYEFGTMLS
jgi:hypothetical protein